MISKSKILNSSSLDPHPLIKTRNATNLELKRQALQFKLLFTYVLKPIVHPVYQIQPRSVSIFILVRQHGRYSFAVLVLCGVVLDVRLVDVFIGFLLVLNHERFFNVEGMFKAFLVGLVGIHVLIEALLMVSVRIDLRLNRILLTRLICFDGLIQILMGS